MLCFTCMITFFLATVRAINNSLGNFFWDTLFFAFGDLQVSIPNLSLLKYGLEDHSGCSNQVSWFALPYGGCGCEDDAEMISTQRVC